MTRTFGVTRPAAELVLPLLFGLGVAACSTHAANCDFWDEALDLCYGGALGVPAFLTNEVYLAEARYPPTPDDLEIQVIDGSTATRQELESILDGFEVLARGAAWLYGKPRDFSWGGRWDPKCDSSCRALEREWQAQLEMKIVRRARAFGGHGVLYRADTEMVGVIMRSTRYIGPTDVPVYYVLRSKR